VNILNVLGWSLAVVLVGAMSVFFSYHFRLTDEKKRWKFGIVWTLFSYLMVGSFCGLIWLIFWLIGYGK
jgi:hypothetical protein